MFLHNTLTISSLRVRQCLGSFIILWPCHLSAWVMSMSSLHVRQCFGSFIIFWPCHLSVWLPSSCFPMSPLHVRQCSDPDLSSLALCVAELWLLPNDLTSSREQYMYMLVCESSYSFNACSFRCPPTLHVPDQLRPWGCQTRRTSPRPSGSQAQRPQTNPRHSGSQV